MKKVAVLGGGITGLTAAHDLSKKGHKVALYEKSPVLGGLAVGFKEKHWEWPLEKAYHHLFASDSDIMDFAKEIGFDKVYLEEPRTDSLYLKKGVFEVVPVDSPLDFLRFPYLTMSEKIRAAIVLAFIKFLPFFPFYEKYTAKEFTKRFMGENMWNVFFKELFRKKFGKYAGNILASFLWARINKRTKKLGYIEGGFQSFVEHLSRENKKLGVSLKSGYEVKSLKKTKTGFKIDNQEFDVVVSTLPSPVLSRVASGVFPDTYLERFNKLNYLHALVLILETDEPILESSYWLNICTEKVPIMLVGQHTNFINKKHYGGNHLAYAGYYLEADDKLIKMSEKELTTYVQKQLKKFTKNKYKIINSYRFLGPFAQPIFDKTFLENKPEHKTPVEDFYIANLDMTYPYDRGTNFAVKLGRDVAKLI